MRILHQDIHEGGCNSKEEARQWQTLCYCCTGCVIVNVHSVWILVMWTRRMLRVSVGGVQDHVARRRQRGRTRGLRQLLQ